MSDTETIRTDNDFIIGTDGTSVGPAMLPMRITTREQAYRTAAWIELMGWSLPSEGDGTTTYEQVRDAVMNT